MTAASANAVELWLAKETIEGQPPATGYVSIPISSESLGPDVSTTQSTIIRADRQPLGAIRTGFEVTGSIDTEFMAAAYKLLIEGAVAGGPTPVGIAPDSYPATTITDSVTPGQKVLEDTGAAGTLGTNYAAGTIARLTTPDGTMPVRIKQVVSADKIEVVVVGGFTITNGVGVATSIATPPAISAGKIKDTFTAVKFFSDIGKYEVLTGCIVDSMTINASPNSICEISFEMVGRQIPADLDGSVIVNGVTIDIVAGVTAGTPPPNNRVFNTIDDVTPFLDGVESAIVTDLSLVLNNNSYGTQVVGTFGNVSVSLGSLEVTGSFESLFEDEVLYLKFLNNTSASMTLAFVDEAGKGYIFDMPVVDFTTGGTETPGQNENVPLGLEYAARLGTGQTTALRVYVLG